MRKRNGPWSTLLCQDTHAVNGHPGNRDMKTLSIILLALLATNTALAELKIRSSDALPAATREKLSAHALEPQPTGSAYRRLQTLNGSFEETRKMSPQAAKHPAFASPSRQRLLDLGCALINESSSGVEKENGALNGVASLYSCPDAHLATYEHDYREKTRQTVTVIDDDYARDPEGQRYAVKTFHVGKEGNDKVVLRWLNPDYEITYELYRIATASDEKDDLGDYSEVLREVARELLAHEP